MMSVAGAERRDGRLETRPESALGDLPRQLAACLLTAARAAHPLSAMLGDLNLCNGQLLDLPAHRLAHHQPLTLREDMPTTTTLRPILDHPIDRPRRHNGRPLPSCPGWAPCCDLMDPCHA